MIWREVPLPQYRVSLSRLEFNYNLNFHKATLLVVTEGHSGPRAACMGGGTKHTWGSWGAHRQALPPLMYVRHLYMRRMCP